VDLYTGVKCCNLSSHSSAHTIYPYKIFSKSLGGTVTLVRDHRKHKCFHILVLFFADKNTLLQSILFSCAGIYCLLNLFMLMAKCFCFDISFVSFTGLLKLKFAILGWQHRCTSLLLCPWGGERKLSKKNLLAVRRVSVQWKVFFCCLMQFILICSFNSVKLTSR
jgi:hypothetical protein